MRRSDSSEEEPALYELTGITTAPSYNEGLSQLDSVSNGVLAQSSAWQPAPPAQADEQPPPQVGGPTVLSLPDIVSRRA